MENAGERVASQLEEKLKGHLHRAAQLEMLAHTTARYNSQG